MLGTEPAAAYRGTFAPDTAEPATGAELPPGWEGVYFPFDEPLSALREDGSPAGRVDLPVRRYVGEDTTFHRPLRYGETVEQTTRSGPVAEKQGRSGRLVFADEIREYRAGGVLMVESTWHDVFLTGPGGGRPAEPAPVEPAARTTVTLDSRQLFRFSALTFNTHRIHYDRDWVREVEGLDDLLVHGPLTRILLLDAARRHHPGRIVHRYAYRAAAPILVGTPITIAVTDTEVVATGPGGGLLATGRIEWGDDV